jgi:Primase C terminal 2 (PriCT-2)/Bifunctional DNA primase/polymerase, N-terminal
MIPSELANAVFIPIPANAKAPRCKWRDLRLTIDEAHRHLASGGNIAIRVGRASGDVVDADLDCAEAIALASQYLPKTQAIFGRASKPRSHWLYRSPGTVFTTFADPLTGDMLLELRADGRDGGAHMSLLPPSITDGERREWHLDGQPADIVANVLARRMALLAIGCLTIRHVSEYAARRPGPDLPDLLWEADPKLGRAAFYWLGKPAPDELKRHPKPRNQMTNEELRLAEVVAAIYNDFDWHGWNRLGMAIYAASGGTEEGFIAFDDLSARSSKYDPQAVRERWRNYRRSPPQRIGVGTLVHLARECGWSRVA